tara:strand:- start:116 stop:316 length:201 start_codon:yes stop_codon:yes gene_type:complete
MNLFKGVFRDIVLVSIGMNAAMIMIALMLDMDDLVLLGGMSMFLCAFGLSVNSMLKAEDEDDDDEG